MAIRPLLTAHQRILVPTPRGDTILMVIPQRLAAGGPLLQFEEWARPCLGLAEQRENGLRRLIGDRQSLNAQLLANLQGLQLGAFLRQIGVNQVADTRG